MTDRKNICNIIVKMKKKVYYYSIATIKNEQKTPLIDIADGFTRLFYIRERN